ncbi:hypothetical protein PHSY_004445 [Pseudozyma hubeiensis SY62]|uniref:Uncharacterized protein n=1 Tax=Pseudozyma hubeiensis (strain SY62) TaxID=1305764 RepID=R9P692_PSEHS|nr:hypothetical protein PHSY_004445 [Pseudozyma hubeiensis SY62]GAC96861.1 hypothetical protein PHSY_004445 [Pseudozyma hubeiensis SY62]
MSRSNAHRLEQETSTGQPNCHQKRSRFDSDTRCSDNTERCFKSASSKPTAQIPLIRRSLSPSPAPAASKLDRRWWFGWSASLGKEPDDARVGVHYIPPHWIFDHPPADSDAFARWLARLRQQQPDFIQVTLPGGESNKAGTIVVGDPETP